MFGLFTSCISMVSLIAHYGAKLYYLKEVKASIQQVGLEKTENFGDYTKIQLATSLLAKRIAIKLAMILI